MAEKLITIGQSKNHEYLVFKAILSGCQKSIARLLGVLQRNPPKRQDPKILEALFHHFSEDDVIPEWNVAKAAEDIFGSNNANLSAKYVPRLDFAVGPFNVTKEEPPFPKREEIKRRGHENETVRKIVS